MVKYTDDEIRSMKKITCKIAVEYLGISPMAVSIAWAKAKADWYDPTIKKMTLF